MDQQRPQNEAPPAHVALPTFTRGRGRPLVYLPGWSLTHAVPRGLFGIGESALIRPLARYHRVHWVGRRQDVPAGFEISDFAADCAAYLRARFSAPVPVVGFSTGGFIALQLAIDHPELVERLVVVGAGATLTARARRSEAHWIKFLTRHATTPGDRADAAATARADVGFDATAHLDRIAAPTLLVIGRWDSSCDPATAAATRAGIPGAQLRLLPWAGHLTSLISPMATQRISDFLTGAGNSAGAES